MKSMRIQILKNKNCTNAELVTSSKCDQAWENWSYLYVKFDRNLKCNNFSFVIRIVSKMPSCMQKSMRNSIKLTDFG